MRLKADGRLRKKLYADADIDAIVLGGYTNYYGTANEEH